MNHAMQRIRKQKQTLEQLKGGYSFVTNLKGVFKAVGDVDGFIESSTPHQSFFFPWARDKEAKRFEEQQQELARLVEVFNQEMGKITVADTRTPF